VEAGRSGVIRSVLCTTSVARIDPGIDEGLANAQAESGLDEIPGPCKLFKSTPNRSIESNRSSFGEDSNRALVQVLIIH
jgi:hypothetical protein